MRRPHGGYFCGSATRTEVGNLSASPRLWQRLLRAVGKAWTPACVTGRLRPGDEGGTFEICEERNGQEVTTHFLGSSLLWVTFCFWSQISRFFPTIRNSGFI